MSPTRITTTERVWSYFVDAILLPFIPQFQGSTSNILDSFLCLRLWPPYPHHSPAWQWSQAADGFISFLLKVSHLCLILAASCKPELILNASGKIHCTGGRLTNKYSRLVHHNKNKTKFSLWWFTIDIEHVATARNLSQGLALTRKARQSISSKNVRFYQFLKHIDHSNFFNTPESLRTRFVNEIFLAKKNSKCCG